MDLPVRMLEPGKSGRDGGDDVVLVRDPREVGHLLVKERSERGVANARCAKCDALDGGVGNIEHDDEAVKLGEGPAEAVSDLQ